MTLLDAAAVLLDMDGTLIDSTATVERVWGEFARQTGLDPAEVLATVHGVPARWAGWRGWGSRSSTW